ncbi:hypothetical protein SXANM310S_03927 [Streptomyces xanthochromogenes]
MSKISFSTHTDSTYCGSMVRYASSRSTHSPHAGREVGEGVGVPGHGLAALGVELGDAVRLDVLLGLEAQLLLDRELDRQTMAVPAGLAGHVVALHRAEAGEDVLEDAGLDVVGAGDPRGGGRALVEDPLRRPSDCSRLLAKTLDCSQKSSTACSRAGRSTWAEHLGAASTRSSSGGYVVRVRRRDERRPSSGVSRGTTLLGGVWNTAPSWGSRSRSTGPGDPESSSGGSGVVSPRARLRAHTVPGSLLAAYAATRPVHASRCGQCRGTGSPGRPVYRRPSRRRVPVTRMAIRAPADSGRRPSGNRQGRELGTNRCRFKSPAGPGRGEPAACPVAAGLGSIYRPSTIRVQDHNM